MREISKIRIGNDIRLAVALRQYFNDYKFLERNIYNPVDHSFESIDANPFVNKQFEMYYGEHFTDKNGEPIDFKPEAEPVSIISVSAVLINNTRKHEIMQLRKEHEKHMRKLEMDRFNALRKHSRFIARFPIEPAMECFNATPYDVCGCGYPTYRAYPRAYLFAPYHGFGVNPHWEGIYKPLFPHPAFPPKDPMIEKFGEEEIKDDSKYVAEVAATDHRNIVEVLFPAAHQLHTGTYSLLITAKLYCPGFNVNNTKTVTVDVPDVFELVDTTAEGESGDIRINVRNVRDILSTDALEHRIMDKFTIDGHLSDDIDTLTLDRSDGIGVDIDLNRLTSIYDAD